MICKLSFEEYSKVEDLLRRRCGVAALEWLHLLDSAKEKCKVYVEDDEGLKGCLILHKGINVFVTTDSRTTHRKFLKVLPKEKEYAFRCVDWMAPIVMEKFKPRAEAYAGIILLTYSTDRNKFRKYTAPRHIVEPLSEDTAEEILQHTKRNFTLEFIRERIKKGYFYGVYDGNELISWVGTLWESNEAYEVGFAYTKEKHRGKGLIKVVTSVVTEKVLQKGKIPILHTVETNTSAIKAFETLGYRLGAREWAYFSAGSSKK